MFPRDPRNATPDNRYLRCRYPSLRTGRRQSQPERQRRLPRLTQAALPDRGPRAAVILPNSGLVTIDAHIQVAIVDHHRRGSVVHRVPEAFDCIIGGVSVHLLPGACEISPPYLATVLQVLGADVQFVVVDTHGRRHQVFAVAEAFRLIKGPGGPPGISVCLASGVKIPKKLEVVGSGEQLVVKDSH